MPRSKTASDLDLGEQNASTQPSLPKEISRFHSAENLSNATGIDAPKPAPRKDSLGDKNMDGLPKPKPTPRRNVPSCIIGSDNSTKCPPPVVPRPHSMIERGNLPPVPNRPETSQNYYSVISDSAELQGLDKDKISLEEPKQEEQEPKENSKPASELCQYETLWGGSVPVVPKRKDLETTNVSLMDTPPSPIPVTKAYDPFDTTSVTNNVVNSLNMVPSQTSQPLPAVPPRPAETFRQNNQGNDELNITQNDIQGFDSNFEPSQGLSRPECPSSPPPPPPREDSAELEEFGLPLDQAPFCPPVPARPQGTMGQSTTPLELPPVPARPAPPPPVPRRPVS